MNITPIKIAIFFLLGVVLIAIFGLIYMLFNGYEVSPILWTSLVILIALAILYFIFKKIRL